MAKEKESKKDQKQEIIEIPQDQVELNIHREDSQASKVPMDLSGEQIQPGDFILIFSDKLSKTPMISDTYFSELFGDLLGDDDSDAPHCPAKAKEHEHGHDKEKQPKKVSSYFPAVMEPAIVVAVEPHTVTASLISIDMATDNYSESGTVKIVPTTKISKLKDQISYIEAVNKLYNDVTLYSVMREASLLNKMLS